VAEKEKCTSVRNIGNTLFLMERVPMNANAHEKFDCSYNEQEAGIDSSEDERPLS
jgi:hypothetical protein